MHSIRHYLSLIRFSHTIFALPFALLGLALGIRAQVREGTLSILSTPAALLLGKVLLCMVFARSAAMAFNRYLDRDVDAKNVRTAVREIPAGVISPRSALLFTLLCSAGFVVTTWFINPLCFYLSFVALFVILFYSYTKRFTPLCHLVLGLGLALAPVGAYLAVTGAFAWPPVLLGGVVLTWVSGFDIIYAMQDEAFDRAEGLYSIPAALGGRRALLVSTMLHVLSATILAWVAWQGHYGWLFWVGTIIFIALLAYQHTIVSPGNLKRVNAAFATTNGLASIVFSVLAITSVFLS